MSGLRLLGEVLGLDDADWQAQYDPARWLALRARLEAIFATRTREDWCARFEGGDACVAPVLSLDEASDHPHNRARKAFIEVDGIYQPAPAPRFSRTPGAVGGEVPSPGADTAAIFRELGIRVP